jgi:hypothetical protein
MDPWAIKQCLSPGAAATGYAQARRGRVHGQSRELSDARSGGDVLRRRRI